jgi:hypothetical protein|tara:strand:- start:1845 stop:2420 length:576 start_codon:yes stop_codon:yes gene_type:complete
MRLELLFLYPSAFVRALSTRTSNAIVAGETIDTAFSPYFPLKHSLNKAQQCNTQSRSMANACTALNTVTRKPGLSGFFSSSERTDWHISAGVAVFENCDIEEGAEEEEEDEAVVDVGLRWFFPYDGEEGDLQDVTLLFFVEEAFAALLLLLLALLPLLHRRLSSKFSFSALLLVLMFSLLSSSLEEEDDGG